MASISTNKKTGERTLQFVIAGKRKSIWLGKVSKRDAATLKQHVEELVAAKMQSNRAPYDDTSRWVAGLDIALHRKLVGVDLAESREPSPQAARATLAAFIKSYVAAILTSKRERRRSTAIRSGVWWNSSAPTSR